MPPPPSVGVITVQAGSLGLSAELPGRLESSRVAQVRARVTGIVQKRSFQEGAAVKAGQPLFEIDAAPYRATLASAEAGKVRAQVVLAQALATLERNRSLAQARAISDQDWITIQSAHKQAVADLASAEAAVQQARLNVEYAQVRSPISGRIGRALVTEGALVSQTEATQLALVQQVDPLYVNFTQSATESLRLRRAIESGELKSSAAGQVRLLLDDGSEYPVPGKLLFTDVTVDPNSGQVMLRAEIPNPKGVLLPGLYVKVRLEQARSDNAILVPQQAVTRGVSEDTVLVVTPDHQVAQRAVKLGGARGSNQWVVLDGLKPGEQVVVDGFQKIRPKSPVTPVPWAAPAAASSPASAPVAGAGSTASSH
ncbi:MAG TPA: efflux RND transporter periplasmic adaptor subunit [Burkholderiaceae bacterium]|nr:efflux RND transporter periplasmic adaptor subunit [Burkholderiaceae bacterium]